MELLTGSMAWLTCPHLLRRIYYFQKLRWLQWKKVLQRSNTCMKRMVAILLSFTIPLALFIILFPKLIIYVVAGPEYYEAAPILQLYMIAGIFRPAQNQAANMLNSIGKPKLCFYINLGYLIVKSVTQLSVPFLYRQFLWCCYRNSHGLYNWSRVLGYFVMKKQIGLELGNVFEYGKEVYKTGYTLVMNAVGKKQVREKVV